MKIDRQKASDAFSAYVKNYDITDEKVRLKIEHTHRVCDLCEQIAKASGFGEDEVEIAWLTGLLHDVGRFEQLRRYGTLSMRSLSTTPGSGRIFCLVKIKSETILTTTLRIFSLKRQSAVTALTVFPKPTPRGKRNLQTYCATRIKLTF